VVNNLKMTELDKKLEKVQYYLKDISIRKQKNNSELLFILLCDSVININNLVSILSTESPKLEIWKSDIGNYNFNIQFENAKGELLLPTKLNPTNYPPLNWIPDYLNKSYLTVGLLNNEQQLVLSEFQVYLDNIEHKSDL
ncbi:hypothetical protein, partial [Yeosuana aromativorans]|uniref:hypothetical protein n=1 Tax=Yeosuana aromativorans TaxID=288019 RepID=UPI001E3AEF1A